MKQILVLFALLGTAWPASAEVTLQLSNSNALVSGLPMDRRVSWVGVVREVVDGVSRVRIIRGMERVTGNQLSLVTGLDPSCSVWSVAALTGPTVSVLKGDRCASDDDIEFSARPGKHEIVVHATAVYGQYLVADESAFRFALRDGSDLDADGKMNGEIVIPLGSMAPLEEGTEAPQTIFAGDRVILVDPDEMRATASEVEP